MDIVCNLVCKKLVVYCHILLMYVLRRFGLLYSGYDLNVLLFQILALSLIIPPSLMIGRLKGRYTDLYSS